MYWWNRSTIEEESIVFPETPERCPSGKLLLPVEECLRVTDISGTKDYVEGQDFKIEKDRRTVTLTPESGILTLGLAAQHPPEPGCPWAYDQKGRIIPFGEDLFAPFQTLFTYRHTGWELPLVSPGHRSSWPINGDNLHLAFFGDSIACGAGATDSLQIAPRRPAWPERVRRHLHCKYGRPVHLENYSKGGMTSQWAAENAEALGNSGADIAIIAWGMNDASEGQDPKEFDRNIRKIVRVIRTSQPKRKVVLVSTSSSNPRWRCSAPELYSAYRSKLLSIADEDTVVADVTSLWDGVVSRKSYWDLSANGLNHPNDFGQALYAQVVCSCLESGGLIFERKRTP